MMWYAAIIRLLRRRVVLAIIFFLSLTYCLVNLLGSGRQRSNDFDLIQYKREKPLVWREDDGTNGTQFGRPNECRNSIQGKVHIVDEEGYICPRNRLSNNGCCKITNKSIQYSCNKCNDEGCCAAYEQCVSCCLNPNKRSILEIAIERATGRQTALFATVKDQFELCLAKCRTDSHSVEHENKYKNPETKYCYAFTEVHESQRDN